LNYVQLRQEQIHSSRLAEIAIDPGIIVDTPWLAGWLVGRKEGRKTPQGVSTAAIDSFCGYTYCLGSKHPNSMELLTRQSDWK